MNGASRMLRAAFSVLALLIASFALLSERLRSICCVCLCSGDWPLPCHWLRVACKHGTPAAAIRAHRLPLWRALAGPLLQAQRDGQGLRAIVRRAPRRLRGCVLRADARRKERGRTRRGCSALGCALGLGAASARRQWPAPASSARVARCVRAPERPHSRGVPLGKAAVHAGYLPRPEGEQDAVQPYEVAGARPEVRDSREHRDGKRAEQHDARGARVGARVVCSLLPQRLNGGVRGGGSGIVAGDGGTDGSKESRKSVSGGHRCGRIRHCLRGRHFDFMGMRGVWTARQHRWRCAEQGERGQHVGCRLLGLGLNGEVRVQRRRCNRTRGRSHTPLCPSRAVHAEVPAPLRVLKLPTHGHITGLDA
eukprot:6172225-Pleurochrysis_carterae.AAC.2